MKSKKHTVVCFGELLWDELPQGKVIGGAPFNVAQRLNSLGASVAMISCVGRDELGRQALDLVAAQGMTFDLIQTHELLSTGLVHVDLDQSGVAEYRIKQPVAWDAIGLTQELIDSAKNAKIFVFGSLAARQEISRTTMESLIFRAEISVFDVNLRPPHFDLSWIMEMMKKVSVVKVNAEELECLYLHNQGSKGTSAQCLAWLVTLDAHKIWCVTFGAEGAQLYVDGIWHKHPGYLVTVADTVGAGDAFLAVLIRELLLRDMAPQEALNQAVAHGSVVASKTGANAKVSSQDLAGLSLMKD
ncbi:MAG: carbohydrate kinase [Flavobacteriaceae bacterium]|nr:carbohydrate kinase [Flavobacteriaceae bacterium]